MGNRISRSGIILSCIPQGSILEPELYILYTSDVPDLGDSFGYLRRRHRSVYFFKKRGSGTYEAAGGRRRTDRVGFERDFIFVEDTRLPSNPVVTYLGIQLDRRLTCRQHILSIQTKFLAARNSLYPFLCSSH